MGSAVRILFVLFAFAACATPSHMPPPLDEGLRAAEEKRLIETAMATALERRARVYDLAWPVLEANTELCEKTAPRAGVTLADRKTLAAMSGGLTEEALETIGVKEGLRIVHAWKGSPAAVAGIPSGAFLEAVNGESVDDPEEAGEAIAAALEDDGRARLTIGGAAYDIEGVNTCDVSVKIGQSQALNAHAMSGITLYTGLIRSLDDEALSAVIAHELAHVALAHKAKYMRNATVTGAVAAGPVLYGLGVLGDRVLSVVDAKPDIPLSTRALRIAAPWTEDFEAEADYVGLYMLARAGGDPGAAAAVFDVFGREAPKSITVRATHPLVPERLARLRATAAEIAAKQQAGLPLIPERKD